MKKKAEPMTLIGFVLGLMGVGLIIALMVNGVVWIAAVIYLVIDLIEGNPDISGNLEVFFRNGVVILACLAGIYLINAVDIHIRGRQYPPRRRWFGGHYIGNRYPEDWEELRQAVLERDGYECGNCHSREHLHVHHIVPLSLGGSNEPSNLRTLCRECHARLHPHMRA